MNIKFIVLFAILTLIVIVFIRIIIYNRYISRTNIKNIERFTSNNNSHVEQSVIDNILHHPRLVFTSIMGETYFINGDDVIMVEDKTKIHIKLNKLLNIKKTIKVDGGYFNYINEMGENEDTVKVFCKKLRYLDTPNEHNILIKKFYDEVISKNSKEIEKLMDEIDTINKDNMMNYVDKKNKYKLKTHPQTKNQLSAIDLAKKNINSNNVKINLV